MSVKRYFIQLSYDGTAYHGWQVQENTKQTVQQVLNDMLSKLLNQPVLTTGCGRTDTGVHATEYFAHFDVEGVELMDEADKWVYRFNKSLPADIAIQQVYAVEATASARFDAVSRAYVYHIHRKKDPFLVNRSALFNEDLDIEKMNEAAQLLKQYKDFSAFSKSNTQTFTNNCEVSIATWTREGDRYTFSISADRFLRNMVRAIVGTLLDVGRGKLTKEDFKKIIESKERSNAGVSVPACGLYLVRVAYPKNYFHG